MKSPKDMAIIQIDITNACMNKCSNCTRHCGWHEKPFFMDFDTFKRAVDSLDGFKGTIGVIGGQPTLHPQFQKFMDYLNQKFPDDYKKPIIIPETDLNNYRQKNWTIYRKKVLLSSVNKNYYKYFQKINDTFGFQFINDHANDGQHQALLVARKDLGISDEQFFKLRDECWIQNLWSASITPKGCFFCQVAGSLDMLFDGPGGWPIQKGWYIRRPQDFQDQIHWCELCGACLKTPSRKAHDQIDIISPTLYSMLKDKKAYKAIHKDYTIFTKQDYDNYDGCINHQIQPYLTGDQKRIGFQNCNIKPVHIDVCFLDDIYDDGSIYYNRISVEDLRKKNFQDWCLVIKNKCNIDQKQFDKIFNPGILYRNNNYYFINKNALYLKDKDIVENIDELWPEEKVCYFNKFEHDIDDIQFSFLMPSYNAQEYISYQLDCVINQNYKNFNCYIIDDGSCDRTVQIIRQYEKKDDRIKLLKIHSQNVGTYIVRNELINAATGDYCLWIDADDQISTNMLSFFAWYVKNICDYDLMEFSYTHKILPNKEFWLGPPDSNYSDIKNREQLLKQTFIDSINNNTFYGVLWRFLIKTELLKKCYDNEQIRCIGNQDFPIWFKIHYYCERFKKINCQRMYIYCFGNGEHGVVNKDFNFFYNTINNLLIAMEILYNFLLKNDKNIDYIQAMEQYLRFRLYCQLNSVNSQDKLQARDYINTILKINLIF